MADKELANITFDLMDFIQDDPEILRQFEEIVEEAVEEWLEVNGYEDWDVEDWGEIDTTIVLNDVQLVPEDDDEGND
tara:strand:- start:1208 stop:1438 length:231 start_codon:yes stop_codon:yes gene_type:complete